MTLDATSRDLNSGFYESQGATTDGFAGQSPSAQVSNTMNGIGTDSTTETAESTTTRGLAAAKAKPIPYSDRHGEFGDLTNQFGSYGEDSTSSNATSSVRSSMLESSWDTQEFSTTEGTEENTSSDSQESAETSDSSTSSPKMKSNETTDRNPY